LDGVGVGVVIMGKVELIYQWQQYRKLSIVLLFLANYKTSKATDIN
jgi:hypothetical protein